MSRDTAMFTAKVLITKLESLRYDIVNHRQLIKELDCHIEFVLKDDKPACLKCLADIHLYIRQVEDVAKVVENSLRSFELGRSLLVNLNERMPP
jgi:ribosomal protein S11